MGSRRRSREQTLQVLYLMDLAGTPAEEALKLFSTHFESDPEELIFVRTLVLGTCEHKKALDEKLEEYSDHWKVSRMPRIDRNILRLGAFELLYSPETPPAAVIDEAVELGKRFGEAKSPSFINGILDRILKSRKVD